MQDTQAYLEELQRAAVDCAMISKRSSDADKKMLFDRLAQQLAILASELEAFKQVSCKQSRSTIPRPRR